MATETISNTLNYLSTPDVIKTTCFACGIMICCDRGFFNNPLSQLFAGGLVGSLYAVGGDIVSGVLGDKLGAVVPISVGVATVVHIAKEVAGLIKGTAPTRPAGVVLHL